MEKMILCQNISAYRAKYNERGIATLEDSKKQAGPSPEIRKQTPWFVIPRKGAGMLTRMDGYHEFETKKARTHHADAQYTERKRLDLAVPKILFPRIV
jgi:hypothetical protein